MLRLSGKELVELGLGVVGAFLLGLVVLHNGRVHEGKLIDLRAVEDAEKRVVVLGRDGVELVIVAPRASDSQREKPARCHVNAIVLEFWAQAEHPQSGHEIIARPAATLLFREFIGS